MKDDKKEEKSVAGFVNELRQVLSSINSAPVEKEAPSAEEPPPLEEPFPLPEPPVVDSVPISEKNPTDSDFWKGNVLGWPSEEEPSAPPSPESVIETENPPPLQESPTVAEEQVLPNLPEPPNLFTDPLPSNEPDPGDIMLRDTTGTGQREFVIPIPGTLDEKPAPEPSRPVDKDFEKALEEADTKSDGLCQIACIFPLGQEKIGQQFVVKLREIGEKSGKPMNIQAVFVQPWIPDRVDMEAWRKSAVLSGADAMFILAAKKDLEMFKTKKGAVNEQKKLRSRTVQMEQVELATLYADIIVELQRLR